MAYFAIIPMLLGRSAIDRHRHRPATAIQWKQLPQRIPPMRSGIINALPPLLAVLAAWPATEALSQASRCRTSNCFNDGDVRNFEVLRDDTMIVYIGRQRCPYLVRVNQISCDLTFVPDVEFVKTRGRTERFGNNRICVYETGIALSTGGFGSRNLGTGQTDPLSGRSLDCRVEELRPVTEDELIELYVEEGIVAPPPPVGTGVISRTDDDAADRDEEADQTDAQAAGPTDDE